MFLIACAINVLNCPRYVFTIYTMMVNSRLRRTACAVLVCYFKIILQAQSKENWDRIKAL